MKPDETDAPAGVCLVARLTQQSHNFETPIDESFRDFMNAGLRILYAYTQFDCRIYQLPTKDHVIDFLHWRQVEAAKIQLLAARLQSATTIFPNVPPPS